MQRVSGVGERAEENVLTLLRILQLANQVKVALEFER